MGQRGQTELDGAGPAGRGYTKTRLSMEDLTGPASDGGELHEAKRTCRVDPDGRGYNTKAKQSTEDMTGPAWSHAGGYVTEDETGPTWEVVKRIVVRAPLLHACFCRRVNYRRAFCTLLTAVGWADVFGLGLGCFPGCGLILFSSDPPPPSQPPSNFCFRRGLSCLYPP